MLVLKISQKHLSEAAVGFFAQRWADQCAGDISRCDSWQLGSLIRGDYLIVRIAVYNRHRLLQPGRLC